MATALVLLMTPVARAWADPGPLSRALPDPMPSDPMLSDQERAAEMERLMAIARQARETSGDLRATVDVTGLPAVGDADAPLALIEFGSFGCGFCRRHFLHTVPRLGTDYLDTGRLRYVFVDYAPDPAEVEVRKTAEAALCAHDQGRYWGIRERFFAYPDAHTPDQLVDHAAAVGLDVDAFTACLEDGQHTDRVEANRRLSRQLRLRGTPTFLLGRHDPDSGTVEVVKRISGARPFAVFAEALQPLAAQAPGQYSENRD